MNLEFVQNCKKYNFVEFGKGSANRLSGGDYAYSYAPYAQTPFGTFKADFIGIDHRKNDYVMNVRTVILDVTDCLNPTLSTGYPGLTRPTDSVTGFPAWTNPSLILPF